MTIGIAVSGPMAGLAAFEALRVIERVTRGAIGGFVSFVVLTDDGGLLAAATQAGGTATLFDGPEAVDAWPPPAFAAAPRAALISSGPNRPEPLIQFTPADPAAGLVTGHRLPHTPGQDGLPLNVAVLQRLKRGETPQQAVEAELAQHPGADAGLIALARDGTLFAADSALVRGRQDRGSFLGQDPRSGARCAVLHNSIFPAAPLAPLAAAIAFDTIAPAGDADAYVTLPAGTGLELGSEPGLHLADGGAPVRLTVTDAAWLTGCRHGAALPQGAAVRRNGVLVGRVLVGPYCVAENGILVSLSGRAEAIIGIRADALEGAAG